MVCDPLSRYWKVVEGKAEARYLIAKRTQIEVDLHSDTGTLWKVHDRQRNGDSQQGSVSLLELKVELARRMLEDCVLCERTCHVNRASGMIGHCGVLDASISSEFLHTGEEPELVPSHTIFFSGCTFDCVYCQNHDISTNPESGLQISPERLSNIIVRRARANEEECHGTFEPYISRNVNWVGGDPTSNLLFILKTLSQCEINLPQIWNSNMYLTDMTLRLLDGVIDLYLTDFKYGNDECAKRLSKIDRYVEIIRRNHLIAKRQAEVIVRHLVLPSHLECCTRPVLTWIADNLEGAKVNVMGQYRPAHNAGSHNDISRPLSASEYASALRIAEDLGLDLVG
ncbi:MAG: radical SAM protein [Methanobacteriota archaeon]|nr:MAG: radical SAM protein [Euryarchaeota archaeon]